MVREVATPRRRSSRIRDKSPQKQDMDSTPQLTTLEEREETPDQAITFTSPEPSKDLQVKTPTTINKMHPSFEEMHPSRFQSTAKKMASGKRLSTVNARTYMHTPSKSATIQSVTSPRAAKTSNENSFASPGFEFKFRPSTDMSSDTQKMMDEMREQAARIKEGLAAQREEQLRKDSEAEELFGRRLATPKGKLGRYSDVHMDQFKKMNSIANHPSSFRADPVKSGTPSTNLLKRTASKTSLGKSDSVTTPALTKSLKRSPSKAELDRPETPSKKMIDKSPMTKPPESITEPDEIQSPAKRFKQHHEIAKTESPNVITSKITPSSQAPPRTKSSIPTLSTTSSITTPTKASLARSSSVKNLKTSSSMIPSLVRSPSMKSVTTPSMAPRGMLPQTECSQKYRTAFVNTLSSVKSILRRPQIRFSDDPVKIAAGTHLSTPTKSSGDGQKEEAILETVVENTPGTPSHRKEKHVNFSVSPTALKQPTHPSTPATPSPSKVLGTFSVAYPNLPPNANDLTTPTHHALSTSKIRASVATPGNFTFRADKTISFTPGGRSTPTIRKVRASDTVAYANLNSIAEKLAQLPSVPHGLSNKKRKRESGVDNKRSSAEDKENKDTVMTNDHNDSSDQDMETGSPAKRARVTMDVTPGKPAVDAASSKPKIPVSAPSSKIPRQKGKGFLSLSRLNALAKPRERK